MTEAQQKLRNAAAAGGKTTEDNEPDRAGLESEEEHETKSARGRGRGRGRARGRGRGHGTEKTPSSAVEDKSPAPVIPIETPEVAKRPEKSQNPKNAAKKAAKPKKEGEDTVKKEKASSSKVEKKAQEKPVRRKLIFDENDEEEPKDVEMEEDEKDEEPVQVCKKPSMKRPAAAVPSALSPRKKALQALGLLLYRGSYERQLLKYVVVQLLYTSITLFI